MKTVTKYTVTAIAESGARKVVADRVGAVRAAHLAKEVESRGFRSEVSEAPAQTIHLRIGKVNVLTD